MENVKEVAGRVERKLTEQTAEFNVLRDRILAVIGFSVALLTLMFTYAEKMKEPFNLILAGPILLCTVSISVLIYATISNPISRGMDTVLIKDLIESGKKENDFFMHDISYNLESFTDNAPKLESLRRKLNWALILQSIVALIFGLCTYFNNI